MPGRSSQISIDSLNRLIITDIFRDTLRVSRKKPRGKSGKAEKGRRGKASYEAAVTDTAGKKRLRKIVLDGVWSMTSEHDLKLRVSGSKSPYSGKTLILRGDVERVSGTALVFRVRQCDAVSGIRSRTIELKGMWRADRNNRITFNAARARGRHDVLRFQGAWQVDKHNEFIYRYSKTVLKTKTRVDRILIFKGYWEFGKDHIVYRLARAGNSFFRFKAALQSRSLRAADGTIKYQIGIKYSKGKVRHRIKQTLTIYGKWKLGRDFDVGFEVEYAGNRRREIRFLAEKLVGQDGTVAVSLKSENGQRLGLEVSFSRAFKNDAELFLSLGRFAAGGEIRAIGGIHVRF
ncbi:MAG: hypothetical protein DRP85_01845 [Candidatus Makaraimicrobium thalassicum]|nr:MAG: hypothetical protein DRP85_01845 [Candidatus Omnitrophota bacterium]